MITGTELSYILGAISNALWVFVFIPQIYANFKNNKSEAMSLLLLFCLILGDAFSIMSSEHKRLSVVIIYSGIYHIFLAMLVASQIVFLRFRRLKVMEDDEDDEGEPLLQPLQTGPILSIMETSFVVISCVTITVTEVFMKFSKHSELITNVVAWLATSIFIASRIPQIVLNYNRKSTEGLSLLSFVIINLANLCYFASIMIVMVDIDKNSYNSYIKANMQWIIGSSCTTVIDSVLFYQFYKYRHN